MIQINVRTKDDVLISPIVKVIEMPLRCPDCKAGWQDLDKSGYLYVCDTCGGSGRKDDENGVGVGAG